MPWIRKGFVSSGHHGGRRGRWQQYQKFLEMTFEAKAETPAFEAPSTASWDFKSDQVSSTDGSSTSGSSSEKGNEEKNEPDKDVSTNADGSSTSGSSSENGNGKKLGSDKVKAETPAETFEVWRNGRRMVWRKVKKLNLMKQYSVPRNVSAFAFFTEEGESWDTSFRGTEYCFIRFQKRSGLQYGWGESENSQLLGAACRWEFDKWQLLGEWKWKKAGVRQGCVNGPNTNKCSAWSQSVQLNDEPAEHHTRATATHRCGRTSSALVVLHFCIFSGGVPWWESDRASKSEKVSAKLFWAKHQSWKAGVKDPPAKRNVGGVSLLCISSPSFWATSSCWTCKDVRWAKLPTAGSGNWKVGHGLFATQRQRVADRHVLLSGMVCAAPLFCIGVVVTLCIFNRLPSGTTRSTNTQSMHGSRAKWVGDKGESLAQAQIAKLQQQLAAERRRSEQLELAVRNKDLQLAEFQSAERAQRKGEVNETAKERPHGEEQIGSNGSGMPLEGSSASTSDDVLPKDPEQPREQAAGALSRTAENGTLEEEPKMEAVRKGRKLVNSKIRRKTKEELEKEQAEEEKDKKKKEEEDSQSADVEVACGQHAMIQPLQRNWRWFHEQREQRAYSAFLEFLLPCLYLHSLKVSQLEKESQEQRRRCKMLTAELENANNLHRTSLKSQQDVLEEIVSRWKSFGIPECDVEVHVTDSGQFLPPTYLPMTPRDSNNLKAKDRADSIKKKERLSDASATMRNASMGKRGRRKPTSLFFQRKRTKRGQCIYQLKTEKPRQLKACSSSRQNELEIAEPEREASQLANESERQTSNTKIQCQSTEQRANVDAAAWKTAEERPETLICTAASDGRSGDVESLNKASSPASDMDTHSGAVASQTEATESNRFLQLITLQDASAENGSEFLPTELFPLLLDFLPVDEVVLFDVRAVSRFFASPKAWVFHLFKLVDIDSLPTLSSEKQMHPVVEYFHKGSETANAKLGIRERRSRMLRTSEGCRGFDLWIYNLHRWLLYQPDLVHHFIDVCLEVLDYQLGEPTANIFWWTATFLHRLYPWPELRMRIARRMLDIAGVAKEQKIVRPILNGLSQLVPACQCIDRHFLAEFVRIVTSDEALLSPCFYKVTEMADLVLADDLARLVAFRRHLSRAFLKPETLSEVRHELLELLAGWPASPS